MVSIHQPRHLLPLWFDGSVMPESTLHGPHRSYVGPPPCAKIHDPDSRCSCKFDAAAPYLAPPPPAAPRLNSSAAAALRIFFLDGHVGPMNDMLATLHEVIGVPTSGIEGVVFMQGMLVRHAIDRRFFGCRLCNIGLNTSRTMASWLLHSSTGRAFTLPGCEKARCREAIHNDETRREFARLFGPTIEKHYDAVACNFPTWQCSLFMYVNVAVLMRFTHRYEHHLQQIKLGKAHRGAASLLHKDSTSMAEEATHVVRHMATMPNVVFAASNAYDWVYLRRNIGVAPVPWPGLSVQLSRVRYTGGAPTGRSEVLFCCGAQPYNKPIAQWAELVVNASRRHLATVRRALRPAARTTVAGAGADGSADASAAPTIRFAWLNDLYPKSFHCKRVKVNASTAAPVVTTPPAAGDAAAPPARQLAVDEARRLGVDEDEARRLAEEGASASASTMKSGFAALRAANAKPKAKAKKGKKKERPPRAKTEEQCGYKYASTSPRTRGAHPRRPPPLLASQLASPPFPQLIRARHLRAGTRTSPRTRSPCCCPTPSTRTASCRCACLRVDGRVPSGCLPGAFRVPSDPWTSPIRVPSGCALWLPSGRTPIAV